MDRHAATRRLRRQLAAQSVVRLPRMHPHMLRHAPMLDAGVDLRDVQIAARYADPRTTMRYDRARNNLDCRLHGLRHLNQGSSRTRWSADVRMVG
ncbi:tyrosine-type recombinase/integrase [Spirillospora sp. NBC_00431]